MVVAVSLGCDTATIERLGVDDEAGSWWAGDVEILPGPRMSVEIERRDQFDNRPLSKVSDGLFRSTRTGLTARSHPTTPGRARIARIDHLVLAMPSAGAVGDLADELGIEIRGERPAGPFTQHFAWLRTPGSRLVLEMIVPNQPAATGARTEPEWWGVAFESDDLDATVAAWGSMAGTRRPAVQAGREIVTAHANRSADHSPAHIAAMSPHCRS